MAIIAELYRYTPQNISLNTLRLNCKNDETHVRMQGKADMLSNAFGYTEAMQEARLLKKLHIENAQQVPRPGGKSIVEFIAECIVESKQE